MHRRRTVLVATTKRSDETLTRWKSTLAVATAAFAYTVMASVGVDFAAFWAVMVFFFYYIPTVGSILAIAAPAILTLVQFDHLTPFLIVLLVFGTIQIVTANMVEPTIMGRTLTSRRWS